MKFKHIFGIALLLSAGAGIAQISDNIGNIDSLTSVEEDSLQAKQDSILTLLDSIRRERSLIRSNDAASKYKDVKFMYHDGELESVLFPAVYDANKLATELLDSAYDDRQRQQAISILQDLNPLILEGAHYWSSQNNSQLKTDYARAYIDFLLRTDIDTSNVPKVESFPQLAYNAAFGATSENDLEAANRYFKAYLATDDQSLRQNVIKYYGQNCLLLGDYLNGIEVLETGALLYPNDLQLLTLAIQTCLNGDMTDRMQPLLNKAMAISPNDEKLINLQAQLYERSGDYNSAVDLYNQLEQLHPNSLEIKQHIATCYYNLGATHYNSSIMEEDEKIASRHRRQSKGYFSSAASALGHILANTPSDMKYLRALASSYAALGEKDKFEDVNRQIRAFKGKEISFNSMPVLIGAESNSKKGVVAMKKVPTYEEFAAPYITKRLGEWGQRGEFEKLEDYKRRLTEGGAETAYNKINTEAEEEYIKNYSRQLVLSDLKCSNYDIDNEIYRIETPYGTTPVKVPSKNHEAEGFKAAWETAQIRAPRFVIKDDKVALSRITYIVNGKKYTYSSDYDLTYETPKVYVDINDILNGVMADNNGNSRNYPEVNSERFEKIWKDSDVDIKIPITGKKATNLFALIIANEHYQLAKKVFGALHDGDSFYNYCIKTLGIPKSNIIFINNATRNQIIDGLSSLGRKVKGSKDNPEVIMYYAGHGLPDDASKEAYMMPIDANPLNISTLIPMKEIYSSLGKMPSEATSVFIDACFSGVDRDGEIINEARGVEIKTKEVVPQGNMFVLSATSAQETALPYKKMHHGIFTYFLLKKLQESKGNATLREISTFVINNTRDIAETLFGKSQNPTVSTSGNMRTEWEKRKLKP